MIIISADRKTKKLFNNNNKTDDDDDDKLVRRASDIYYYVVGKNISRRSMNGVTERVRGTVYALHIIIMHSCTI